MTNYTVLATIILLSLVTHNPLFAITNPDSSQSSDNPEIVFKCVSCGKPCDTNVYKSGGTCSECGMPLFATYSWLKPGQNKSTSSMKNKTVAILVFEHVQIIDFAGPYEVFGQAGAKVITVAEKDTVINTFMNLKIIPDYTFQTMPNADIILIPGGMVDPTNENIINWIKKVDKESEKVVSVCSGAFFLSSAGLLNGLEATTFFPFIPLLKEEAPQTKVVDNKRFVNNGHIITSAGLSSGIDAALFVVSEYLGVGRTQEIAVNLEYNWDPNYGFVRGKLADKYLIGLRNVFKQFANKTILYAGNDSQWEFKTQIESELTNKQLMDLITAQIAENEKWKNTSIESNKSDWIFYSSENEKFEITVDVDSSSSDKLVTVKIAKI